MQKPFTSTDPQVLLLDAIEVLTLSRKNTLSFIKNFLKYSLLTRPPYPNSFLCYNYDLKRFQFYNRTSQDVITLVKPNKYSYTIGTIIIVDQLQIYPMKSLIIFPVPVDQLINRYNHFKAHPDDLDEYLDITTTKISEFISTITLHEMDAWKEYYINKKPNNALF